MAGPEVRSRTGEKKEETKSVVSARAMQESQENIPSDLEAKKLRFANQPFLGDLYLPKPKIVAKEEISKPNLEPPVLENEKYKIESSIDGKFGSFKLKDHSNQEILLDSERPIGTAPSLARLASDTLTLAKKHFGELTIVECRIDNNGIVELSCVNENKEKINYLGSPRFILKRNDQEKELREKYSLELKECEKTIAVVEDKVKAFGGAEGLGKTFEELKSLAEKEKKGQIGPEAIEKVIKELNGNIDLMSELKALETLRSSLVDKMTSSVGSDGFMVDGTLVNWKLRNDEYYSVELFGKDDKAISLESQVMVFKDGRLVNNLKVIKLDSEGNFSKEVQLSSDGDVVDVSDYSIGVCDSYSNGKLINSNLYDANKFFCSIEKMQNHPHFESLFIQATAESPELATQKAKACEEKIDLSKVLELAVSKMTLESIQFLKEKSKEYLSGANSEKPSMLALFENKEIESILTLLSFRETMLVDARDLVRSENLDEDYSDSTKDVLVAATMWNKLSTRGYFEINREWIDWSSPKFSGFLDPNNPELSKKENYFLIALYLDKTNREIDKDSVLDALVKIHELKNDFRNTKILEGRNVILAAHSESIANPPDEKNFIGYKDYAETYKFGKPALRQALDEGRGEKGSFQFYRAALDGTPTLQMVEREIDIDAIEVDKKEIILKQLWEINAKEGHINLYQVSETLRNQEIDSHTISDVVEALRGTAEEKISKLSSIKKEIVKALLTTPPPMTFVFDGHGGVDGLYLTDGILNGDLTPKETEQTIKFTSAEIAEILKARSEKFGDLLKENPDIMILDACYSANFVENVDLALGAAPRPIFIGPSEYNQVSFNSPINVYGSSLYPSVLEIEINREGPPSTLGDLMDNQFRKSNQDSEYEERNQTNPFLSVPDRNGVLRRISAVDREVNSSLS